MKPNIQPLQVSLFSRPFLLALSINFIWINISEVFRYFTFIMPMMRETFPNVSDVAPMNISVFLIWGIWDMIVVLAASFIPWLILTVFGNSFKKAVLAGTAVWLTIFTVLWLGMFNMNLATPEMLMIALPLAWFEMVNAALIVWYFCFHRKEQIQT